MIALIIVCVLGWIATGLMTWIAYRFYKKAVVYDEVFQFLADDVYTNLNQFNKMSKMNVLMEEPEVQQAHKNMKIMSTRLEEILRRMEQATGLRLRPPPAPPRPKVI